MRRVYWQEGRKACRILCDVLVSDWISDCCLEFKAPEECDCLKKSALIMASFTDKTERYGTASETACRHTNL